MIGTNNSTNQRNPFFLSGRRGWVSGLLICAVLLIATRFSSAESGILYNASKGTLVLAVKDASLRETLKRIGDATGIKVYISPALDEKLTLSFGPLPLEEGIKRVIHHYNHAVIYEQERDSTGKTVVRPVSIKIFQKSPAESTLLLTGESPPMHNGDGKNRMKKEENEQRDREPIQVQKQTTDDYLAQKEEWENRMKTWNGQVNAAGSEEGPIPARPPKPGIASP